MDSNPETPMSLNPDSGNISQEINWSTVQNYLETSDETPIPMAGSTSCVLLIRPGRSVDLQLRTPGAAQTPHSALPPLSRLEYIRGTTTSYVYLSISCRIVEFNESVLKFFNTVSSFFVIEKMSPSNALKAAHNRWKRLLESDGVISQTILQGLWGELWVLGAVLRGGGIDPGNLLQNWSGPLEAPNDFTFGKACVEVKTTSHSDDIVKISSMQQLDASDVWIILLHVFHAAKKNGGKSVSDLLKEIRSYLSPPEDEILLERIELLAPVEHFTVYDSFTLKESSFPKIVFVDDKLPILTESRLKKIFNSSQVARLVSVEYSLDLSESTLETMDLQGLFNHLSAG